MTPTLSAVRRLSNYLESSYVFAFLGLGSWWAVIYGVVLVLASE